MAATSTPESSEERRIRLIGVARDLIAREGVGACTFRRLAASAGTSTRPFTHAFGTRDNLLRAVALTTWDDSPIDVHATDAPVEHRADWDCIAELRAMGEHWLPLTEQAAIAERIYLEIQLFSLNEPELRAMLIDMSVSANAKVVELLDEGKRRGQVRDDIASDELVVAYWALMDGLSVRAIYQTEPTVIDRTRRLWRDGIERLLRP